MNRRLSLAKILVIAACLGLLGKPALGWNPSGHMIVAMIAWDQMDEATRAKAIAILKEHPRFQDHFQRAMPKDVVKGSQAEQDAWAFAYAATWPDVVREVKGGVTRE